MAKSYTSLFSRPTEILGFFIIKRRLFGWRTIFGLPLFMQPEILNHQMRLKKVCRCLKKNFASSSPFSCVILNNFPVYFLIIFLCPFQKLTGRRRIIELLWKNLIQRGFSHRRTDADSSGRKIFHQFLECEEKKSLLKPIYLRKKGLYLLFLCNPGIHSSVSSKKAQHMNEWPYQS